MFSNFDLSHLSIILCACTFVCCIAVYVIYIARVRRVSRYCRAQNADDTPCECTERASIIVYANDQADALQRLLPALLEQEYEPGYEVIVVNDGGTEDTRDLVERMRITHHNLYQTFTPGDSRALSRKKLALTLGIKAARNPIVVNVTARVIIPSNRWLAEMMRSFADPGVEVVLGYAVPSDNDTALGHRRRAFDWCAAGVTWLTSAIAGKPYRGTEYNLAYRTDTFFRNKGFSRSLNLNYGDDDIFISEIANARNCCVQLSQDSIVHVAMTDHARKQGIISRHHHFTGRYVRHTSRRLMAAGSWLTILATFTGIAAAIAALLPLAKVAEKSLAVIWPNITIAIAAILFILILYILIAITWRATLKSLGLRRLLFSLPWLMMTRPLRLLHLSLRTRLSKDRFYTWR